MSNGNDEAKGFLILLTFGMMIGALAGFASKGTAEGAAGGAAIVGFIIVSLILM